jgi:uncharacterized protein (DUF849 family)
LLRPHERLCGTGVHDAQTRQHRTRRAQVFACVELEDETARADALAVFAHVRNGTDDSEHTADNSYLRRIVPKSADRQADLLLCVFGTYGGRACFKQA